MSVKTIKPDRQYLVKLRLTFSIIALAIMLAALLLTFLITMEEGRGGLITFPILMALNLLWYAVAMGLSGPYFNSLQYEIQDDEVIVQVGIWTKSVKHVPYRTVTNLTAQRDILDRLLKIGTLNIQTAGMSGTTGAEESLVGLPNVQEIYDLVAMELRRFRGGMTPTMADAEDTDSLSSTPTLTAILTELQAIRKLLEKK